MAIVTEIIDSAESAIKKVGTALSAGQSTRSSSAVKTVVAQYPAERASATDGSSDVRVSDLYKNGVLFTAYDFKSRTSTDMRTSRTEQQKASQYSILNSGKSSVDKTPLANILMPRSKSDVDSSSHRFNDVGESLITRGGGNIGGILSNVASTAVFGAIDSVTQGAMADHSEQIYNTARSMYAGADNRTKVFVWDLTPRNIQDLVQIVKIYEVFNYLSYGETGNSEYAKELKAQLDAAYKTTFINPLTPDGADTSNTIFENITSFLTNVIVVSNPTIWYIRNFGTASNFDGKTDIFGPAQISSVRFDKSPNGAFNGLAIAPNLPSTFTLEVTFREILTLNRGTLYATGIS